MALTIAAHIHANPGNEERVGAELSKLVAPTLAEAGCVQYDLHRDDTDPAHFMFYETWETRDLWQAHMAAPHIKAFGQATEGAVASAQIFEMSRVD